ncbi:tyrosine-protein phosphatase 3-like [Ctenocephalides felis]|uniref:tyrosine-protein phosphatase 3-like n=1 Tax=Ctenocephalides felis TaxID=7515 RepID=UPI000E6E4BFA|nr:tyrosine-protein phosphatase 3-like [Ctenocephalides felis]
MDNTSSTYAQQPYYQNMNMGTVPSNTQVYQADLSSYNSMNYVMDYSKFGTDQSNQEKPVLSMSGYNYQQYLPSTSNKTNTIDVSANIMSNQNYNSNFANKSVQYTNASNIPNIPQEIPNAQYTYSQGTQNLTQQIQTSLPNTQNLAQNYTSMVSSNSLPNKTPEQNYVSAVGNVQNYVQPVQNLNYQQVPQSFANKQDYSANQQIINKLGQQISNLTIQNPPTVSGYNTMYQQNQAVSVPSNLPLSSSANVQYNQAMSYSGHPGYSYDPSTGLYQYSSGYQNMQMYDNQMRNYTGNYGDPSQTINSSGNWQQNYQYTNAGNNLGTSNTLSSQAGHLGQSFAQQYASNASQISADQYYLQMYGAAGGSMDGSNIAAPSAVYPLTPQSPMTYMNSGASITNTTFSQDSANSNPTTSQKHSAGVQSNVDLLAGLDFSSSVPILTPEQNSVLNKKSENDPKNLSSADTKQISGVSTNKNSNVREEEKNIAEKKAAEKTEDIKIEPKNIKTEKQNKLLDLQQTPSKENLVMFLHEVERQEKYLEGISTKTLNGPTPLETKWKELQDLLALDVSSRSISVARCYPAKNRCPDHLPYDQTRVQLPDPNNDYINASYVKNMSPVCPDFIVTQAPMSNTLADFWSMVWNENIETIACLLNSNELDVVYFPTQKDSSEIFGDYKITLQTISENEVCIERVMSIKGHRDKPPRDFLHLQIKSTPSSCEPICGFADKIVSCYQKQHSISHPVLLHCLNGNNVCGMFAYTICSIANSKMSAPCLLDSSNICHLLCSQRKGMIRDRHYLLLAMEAEVHNARALLNKHNLMTSYQIQNKSKNTIPPPQEVLVKDPLADLDPLWKIRKT